VPLDNFLASVEVTPPSQQEHAKGKDKMSRLADVSRIKLLIVSAGAVIAMGSVAAVPATGLLAAHDGPVAVVAASSPDENNWG
jgi:hypothetical protein